MGRLSEYVNSRRRRTASTASRSTVGNQSKVGAGTKEIDKELQEVSRKLDLFRSILSKKDFETILAQAAEIARNKMAELAPASKKAHYIKEQGAYKKIKPGNLKKSIQVFKAKGKGTARVVLVGPVLSNKSRIQSVQGTKRVTRRNRAYYGPIVNYGSVRQPPQRFIERARTSSRSAVISKLKEGVAKYVKKEVKDIFG
jgi:HK97 gp10 family phage protein